MKNYKLTINEIDGIKYRFESTDFNEIIERVERHNANDIEVDIEDVGTFTGRQVPDRHFAEQVIKNLKQ